MDGFSFGALLKRYRLAAGLTHEGLAERAQISVRAISDLERGASFSPRNDTIRFLASALGLSAPERAAFEALARGGAAYSPASAGQPGRGGSAGSRESSPDEGGARRPGGTPPPLVGRADELALLDRHLAGTGPPLLVFAGEPGIGKTRLLQEAAMRAARLGWRILEGGCQRRDGQEPYAPLLEALERHIRDQAPVQLREELRGCAWLVHMLPELAEGPIEPLPAWTPTPEHARRLTFRAAARFLANAAEQVGLLLVLDDLQWAGDDALDLLATLVRSAPGTPLRFVGAYRDTEVRVRDPLADTLADLAQEGLATRHRLLPLALEDAARLLDALLEGADQDRSALREDLLQRTEGVPFFLVSSARGLLQGQPENGVQWDVAASIRQRVAVLQASTQEVLSIAAVVGRNASTAIIAAVSRRSEGEVLTDLEVAYQAGLLKEGGDQGYQFAHDVIREVLDADLGTARRALLNRHVAEAVERNWLLASRMASRAPGEPPAELLAYHFGKSGERERTLTYLVTAAERARRAAAHREEAVLLGQAITLVEQTGRREVLADLRTRRGRAFASVGMWVDARDDLEAALAALAPERGERRASLLIELAMLSHWLADVPGTRRFGAEARALAEALDQADLAAGADAALALADSSDGELQASLTRYRHAFATAGARRHASLLPALEMWSLILYWRGDHDEAIVRGRQAVDLALTGSGRYAEALRIFAEARDFSREYEIGQWMARSTAMCGGLHLEVFDFAVAEALAEEARELAQSLGWPLAVISGGIDLLLNLARRHEVGGRAERILREVTEAIPTALGVHGWLCKLRLAEARAELSLARGDWAEAIQSADDAIAQSRLRGRVKYEVAGMETRAKALAAIGHRVQAITQLRAAIDRAHPVGDPAMFLRIATALLAIEGDDALATEADSAVRRIIAALPDEDMRRRFKGAEPVRFLQALLHR